MDRPVGDVEAATRVAHIAADTWGMEEPELLRSGMNAIFATGAMVLRVGRPTAPAEVSLELARFWTSRGVRVAQPARDDVVMIDGLSVTAWERISTDGASAIDWRRVGAMIRRVHDTDVSLLPARVPLPSPTAFAWWDFDALFDRAADSIDDAARRGLRAVVDRHDTWREFDHQVVCHGDVHPGNVLMSDGGPVLLDWDLLTWAPPGWDHAPMMTWASRWGGDGSEYPAFADGYGTSLIADPVAIAYAELRLVAATLMRVQGTDPSGFVGSEAATRLRYWRGEQDAPQWIAQ